MTQTLRTVALACALAALWLLGRRYAGIIHDATLYLGQGLRRLHPEALSADLFFAHGGQDAFTLFPHLYAPLIDWLGAGSAALTVTLIGQAAFVAAAAALVLRCASGPARWWALALLAVVSGYYGGVGTFRIAEPFATARSLAEPLVVGALACILAARLRWAFALLMVAALLHPLVAASGLAVLLVWHALERRRVRELLFVAIAGIAVVMAFPQARLRFDPEWREAVLERSPHLFLLEWHAADWARFAWSLCAAGLAAGFAAPAARRLIVITAGLALAGVVASGIAVDLCDSVLAAVLQLWRAHWLVHLLAIVHVPVIVLALWRLGDAGRAAAVCVAASLCFGRAEQPAAAFLLFSGIALYAVQIRRPHWIGPITLRAISLVAVCAASVGLMFEIQTRMPLEYGVPQPPQWGEYAQAALTVGGLAPLALVLWLCTRIRFQAVAVAICASALALSVMVWDARTPWREFIEQASAEANPFRSDVRPGAQVFWRDSGAPAWLVLGAPSWFSVDQGAGIVFSRATAIEYAERKRASGELRTALDYCLMTPAPCRIERQHALSICARRDAPDYLVLTAPLEGETGKAWTAAARVNLYLYSCRQVAGKDKAGARPASS